MLPAFKASGNVSPCRFVKISGDFTVNQSGHGDVPFGISGEGTREAPIPNASAYAAIDGDPFRVYGDGECCELECDMVVAAGNLLVPDQNGKGMLAMDGEAAFAEVLRGNTTAGNRAEVYISRRQKMFGRGVVDKTGNYTVLAASDQQKILTNAGSTGAITFALPAATIGQEYRFRVLAAQELRIDPNGSETIALPSTGAQGAAGKYLMGTALGDFVHIKCEVSGTWNVVSYNGTWTAEA